MCGSPEQTLTAVSPGRGRVRRQGEHVGRGDVGDVHEVAPLAAVLQHPRRLAPFQRGAEDRRDAGVRGVARHPRPVDVVVAQRPGSSAGLPRPRGDQVLLGGLGGGVGAARVERGVLADESGDQVAAAAGAARLEAPGVEVGRRPRARAARPRAPGSRSGPRRRRPSSPPAPAGAPRRRASRRAARPCRGRCARRRPGRPRDRRRARPSPPGGTRRRRRAAAGPAGRRRARRRGPARAGRCPAAAGAVRLREQRVEQDRLVAVGDEPVRDVRPDEPGPAGDQNAHGRTVVRVCPGGPPRSTLVSLA